MNFFIYGVKTNRDVQQRYLRKTHIRHWSNFSFQAELKPSFLHLYCKAEGRIDQILKANLGCAVHTLPKPSEGRKIIAFKSHLITLKLSLLMLPMIA